MECLMLIFIYPASFAHKPRGAQTYHYYLEAYPWYVQKQILHADYKLLLRELRMNISQQVY